MTRDEMLKRMKITDEDLKDLLQRYRNFHSSLNESQRAVVTRSLPTVDGAAKTFGPDVTAEDIQQLFGTDPGGGMFGGEVMKVRRNK